MNANDPLATVPAELAAGRSVSIVATGTSMRPHIEPGQVVTIAPVSPSNVRVGDIVLVRWKKGRLLAHFVVEIQGDRFLIGNAWGKKNGWAGAAELLGRVTDVGNEDRPGS